MPRRTSVWMLTALVAMAAFLWSLPGCDTVDPNAYRAVTKRPKATAEKATTVSVEGKTNPSTDDKAASESPVEAVAAVIPSSKSIAVSALAPVNAIDVGNVRSLLSLPAANADPAANAGDSKQATTSSDVAAPTPVEPRKVEVLIKDKKFRPEPKSGALRVSFDDLDLLKVLNMDPVDEHAEDLMPDWLTGLKGKTVRLRGFMFPTFDTEGIERFVLARDNQICCFGRDPKVYDLVQIDMKPGKTTHYIPATRAFDVVGTFKIHMEVQDGKPFGLYTIDNAEVIDH